MFKKNVFEKNMPICVECRRFRKDIEIFVRKSVFNFHLIYTHFELLWLSKYFLFLTMSISVLYRIVPLRLGLRKVNNLNISFDVKHVDAPM